jgi:quinoprotein glucose dehydrogenase
LRVPEAFDGLIKALRTPDERVSMFAAQALAKLGNRDMLPQLIVMLRDAGDHDPNLRSAYVQALVGANDFGGLIQAAENDSPAVRMGALLAMRQLRRAEIARFLRDPEPLLVLEAARAIHDENIASALPPLAAIIDQPSAGDALLSRVLNANFRIGEPDDAARLARFAARDDLPEPLRLDALHLLARWASPPPEDYVTGERLTLTPHDPGAARDALEAVWPKLASDNHPGVLAAARQARAALAESGR